MKECDSCDATKPVRSVAWAVKRTDGTWYVFRAENWYFSFARHRRTLFASRASAEECAALASSRGDKCKVVMVLMRGK